MDLRLFFAVLWRSKALVLGGVILGAVLAVLSYGTPSFAGGRPVIKPRGAEVWGSESQLLISQTDFPYRQSSSTETPPTTSLSALSPVYAALANGNAMESLIRRRLGTAGTVKASEDLDAAATTLLPFVIFNSTASTPREASRLASGAASIFQAYVAHQEASVGPSHRIDLSIVEAATKAKLIEGHKLSIPILIFVAILLASVSLVFLKENMRQRAAAGELGHVASEELAAEGPAPERPGGERAHREPVVMNGAGDADGAPRGAVQTGHAG